MVSLMVLFLFIIYLIFVNVDLNFPNKSYNNCNCYNKTDKTGYWEDGYYYHYDSREDGESCESYEGEFCWDDFINWEDDEDVVHAAIPTVYIGVEKIFDCVGGQLIGNSWKEARQNRIVRAFELQFNPSLGR
jgi:hypothetical protein